MPAGLPVGDLFAQLTMTVQQHTDTLNHLAGNLQHLNARLQFAETAYAAQELRQTRLMEWTRELLDDMLELHGERERPTPLMPGVG